MPWNDLIHSRLFGSKRSSHPSKAGKNPSRRLTVERLEDRLAPSASMVADLTVYTLSSNPSNLTDANGTLFFSATTTSGTNALFKSDGTAAGTVQLTFGPRLTGFDNFLFFNGKLFFGAGDSTLGYGALWTTDGTVAGTVPFLAAGNGVDLNAQTLPVIAGNKFYFQAFDYSTDLSDLWVSDGTSAGTHPVQPGNSSDPTSLYDLTNVNGKLFFVSYASGNFSLWTSNGTAAGTSMVMQLGSFQPSSLTVLGSKFYFEMYDAAHNLYALWKSDGTAAGTVLVSDIGTTTVGFSGPIAFNNKLYFAVYDTADAPNTGFALWTSDGTAAGTGVFKYNGNTTVVQILFTAPWIVFNNALYFQGWDSTNNYSLWKTDGISNNNNTGTVQSSGSSPFNSEPTQLTIVNNAELYFLARNYSDAGNNDLWKTDGTSAGTAPVQTSGFGRGLVLLTASGSKLFFQAYDVDANNNWVHGKELWVSGGTNAGTRMVTDINTATGGTNPSNLVAIGNEIFFSAVTDIPFGTFLWQSDGTAANTVPVQTSTGIIPTFENNWISVGNTLFFTGDGANGNDLWTTGTSLHSATEMFPTGTNPFNNNSSFDSTLALAFANLNGTLYFGAYDAANSKYALWRSNGTASGTTVVADLDPTNQLAYLTAAGNDLFWQEYDPVHSTNALWEYNGTTAFVASDIGGSGPLNLTAVGSNLFFQAYDSGTSKYALWTSNGTTTTMLGDISTAPLAGLVAFNGKLFFGAEGSYPTYYEMWTSDGTVAGTAPFLNNASQPVPVSSVPFPTVVGSELFYANYDPLSNLFLLGKTDGTAAGTGTVQASASGNVTLAQNPSWLANDNGMLVFQAWDSAHGYELWQSDGTANGTLLAADIVTGPGSSNPLYLKVAGNQVFFNATDLLHGSQLWTATLAPTVVTAGLSGPSDGVTQQHRAFVLTASDSNSGNNSAGFSFAINWGDGSSQTVTGQSGLSTDHQYANVGTFTVSVTATNLADNVTSAAVTQSEAITQTEVQGGNLALGGVAGNNAFLITPGRSGTFTFKVNGTAIITNFKPAMGQQIFLYPGNGTTTFAINDSGISNDAFVLGTGYVTFKGTTFVPQGPGNWTINGNNGADTFTISGAANASIVGGSGKNTYKFVTGGSLTGTLNGGSGILNTLDYSGYASSGVIVDLPLGSATGVNGGASGGIIGIRNVTGSKNGGDILVGDSNPNVLKALKGHNILIGGSGGGDTLTSGGADILIAGTTSYDTNIGALQFIFNEWKNSTPATYASTINTIETSATDPLNATTVFDSGTTDLADTLNGKGTSMTDWFFAHTTGGTNPNDTITGLGSGDTVTSI